MIFYAWTALTDSDPAALGDRDPAALSDNDQAMGARMPAAPDGGHPGLPGSSVAMGISDDRGRAMKAGEETLGSGRAVVVVIEAVRPAMTPRTLAPCYVRTGVAWLGRCTAAGEVSWDRFFIQGGPGDERAPGRIEP